MVTVCYYLFSFFVFIPCSVSRKPFWKTEELGRRDLTRNHVTSNEPLGSRSSLLPYRYPVYEYRRERHEIAEIETVL